MPVRVTVHWSDLPSGLTAYHRGIDGVERAVRRQRCDIDTMMISRVRPYGEHHWADQNRVTYDYLASPETETVEIDAVEG